MAEPPKQTKTSELAIFGYGFDMPVAGCVANSSNFDVSVKKRAQSNPAPLPTNTINPAPSPPSRHQRTGVGAGVTGAGGDRHQLRGGELGQDGAPPSRPIGGRRTVT